MSLERKLAEYRKEFYKIYHEKIVKLLTGFEEKRKKALKKMLLCEGIILSIAVCIILLAVENGNIEIISVIGFITLFIVIFVYVFLNSNFIKEVKSYCMRPILKIFGNIEWGEELISDSELEQSGLFSPFNRRSTDDTFSGEYSGVKLAISETNLVHESGSGKNKRHVSIFDGVVIKFKSNKDIKAKTVVATRGDLNIGVGGKWLVVAICIFFLVVLGRVLFNGEVDSESVFFICFGIAMVVVCLVVVLKDKEKKLKSIKLEDPKFEKRFKVYSEDEVEGRYLITTSFMERLLNLKTSFGARKVKCSFFGENVMFAISTSKNLFEMGNLFSKMEEPKQMEIFFEEFSSILLLVDYFKLDKKIGL